MSFSDICIETICDLSAELVHYGKHDELKDTAPMAVLTIHSLAKIAAELDHTGYSSNHLRQQLVDGYFIGNLLDAAADQGDKQSTDFLGKLAKKVPELAAALGRYEEMAKGNNGLIYAMRFPQQSAALQSVLETFHAQDFMLSEASA